MRVDLPRAFPHALQAPVVGAATAFENRGVDAAPVVANPQTELPRLVEDLHLDVGASGVSQGIEERLATDRKGFLQDQGFQLSRPALDYRLERGTTVPTGLLRDPLEG